MKRLEMILHASFEGNKGVADIIIRTTLELGRTIRLCCRLTPAAKELSSEKEEGVFLKAGKILFSEWKNIPI